ncbi:hypothetical protein [Acinetobacter sp.]|jgi:hypothetical protein|uniref:hypothetical protein n=1 Tax=Acinetobacter sp. TaxID=472 RepID=UPI002829CB0C|nr:hypothetical protein [Acinetobacter sp.]MDR0235182.1 hypothetical protein [Acinetobacter sp.]
MRFRVMSNFEIHIQYPNHTSEHDMERISNLEIAEVLTKFESISWRRQRVLQLQLDGISTMFKVIHQTSKEFLMMTLNAYAKTEDFEFKLESNMMFVIQQRELFGLMTRKNKEIFSIKHSTLDQVKASLTAFLNQDRAELENIFSQSKENSSKDNH